MSQRLQKSRVALFSRNMNILDTLTTAASVPFGPMTDYASLARSLAPVADEISLSLWGDGGGRTQKAFSTCHLGYESGVPQ
jgi:hypothetical protein